jgi:hypothetical protein
LEYQKNLQYLNAVLIIGAGSLVAYLAALILNLEKWIPYTSLVILISTLTTLSFIAVNKNLEKISKNIRNLKE